MVILDQDMNICKPYHLVLWKRNSFEGYCQYNCLFHTVVKIKWLVPPPEVFAVLNKIRRRNSNCTSADEFGEFPGSVWGLLIDEIDYGVTCKVSINAVAPFNGPHLIETVGATAETQNNKFNVLFKEEEI